MAYGDNISRQAAIDALDCINGVEEVLRSLPPAQPTRLETLIKALEQEHKKLLEMQKAQPEIIRCKDCKFASGDSRICMKFGYSPIGELDFCAWAERKTDEREDTIRAGNGTHEVRH